MRHDKRQKNRHMKEKEAYGDVRKRKQKRLSGDKIKGKGRKTVVKLAKE